MYVMREYVLFWSEAESTALPLSDSLKQFLHKSIAQALHLLTETKEGQTKRRKKDINADDI